jgi:hypothetical protein
VGGEGDEECDEENEDEVGHGVSMG